MKPPRMLVPTTRTTAVGLPIAGLTVTELCCDGEPTQHQANMANCESMGHTLAANAGGSSSLDAIVKVADKDDLIQLRKGKVAVHGSRKYNVFSDHDCLKAEMTFVEMTFPLMTHNIEGLCDGEVYSDTHASRKANHRALMKEIAGPGMIMCFQELALKGRNTRGKAEENGTAILQALNEDRPELGLQMVFDGYTGGVMYDMEVWRLDTTIEISRKNAADTNKKSNAYLFVAVENEMRRLWVVNIHLKALMGAYLPFCDPNATHIPELTNILQHVYDKNKDFRVPVFLMGDYNSTCAKNVLVNQALNGVEIVDQTGIETF